MKNARPLKYSLYRQTKAWNWSSCWEMAVNTFIKRKLIHYFVTSYLWVCLLDTLIMTQKPPAVSQTTQLFVLLTHWHILTFWHSSISFWSFLIYEESNAIVTLFPVIWLSSPSVTHLIIMPDWDSHASSAIRTWAVAIDLDWWNFTAMWMC